MDSLLWPILTWLASVATALALPFTKFGEKFLGFVWDEKLAALKHEQDQKIEALRADLQHLADRGKHSNEREFQAISIVWERFVEALQAVRVEIVDAVEYPQLNRLSDDDVTAFLNSTDFSEQQRNEVLGASDKEKAFSRAVSAKRINTASKALSLMREALWKNAIYVPPQIFADFWRETEVLTTAHVECLMGFRREGTSWKKRDEVLADSEPMFQRMSAAIRARIFRL